MSDLKEQAKKIIAKGKLLNDPELINMGLEMLEVYSSDEDLAEEKIVAKNLKSSDITNQFKVNKKNAFDSKYSKSIPVTETERSNNFIDDFTEAVGDIGKTPSIEKTPRDRKAPLVNAECSSCGKKEKVNVIFVQDRESYTCNSCLLRKGK